MANKVPDQPQVMYPVTFTGDKADPDYSDDIKDFMPRPIGPEELPKDDSVAESVDSNESNTERMMTPPPMPIPPPPPGSETTAPVPSESPTQ